jgi:hypothetical protein
MKTSQNGWPASPDKEEIDVGMFIIDGIQFPGGVRRGDVALLLSHVAQEFHRRVEPLRSGSCWGYAYRDIIGASTLSNHSSGTAIDINADMHPLGAVGTFTYTQIVAINRILEDVSGVVRWGGSYAGRVDEMHFEIDANTDACHAAAQLLLSKTVEDNNMMAFVRGDSTAPGPLGGKAGDYVYLVKWDPELPRGAIRRYMPNDAIYQIGVKLRDVLVVPQKMLDIIPKVPGSL